MPTNAAAADVGVGKAATATASDARTTCETRENAFTLMPQSTEPTRGQKRCQNSSTVGCVPEQNFDGIQERHARRLRPTRDWAERMPYNNGSASPGLFSLWPV